MNTNYSKMYDAPEAEVEEQIPVSEPEAEVEIDTQEPATAEPEQTIVCPEKCEYVRGTVSGCSKLNVRAHPNATAPVRYVIAGGSEVQICTAHNYEDWYEVCTESGVEGYCMAQYVTVNQ